MRKVKFYIVWIEGLSPRYGEKLKQFITSHRQEDYVVTSKMTKALRVKPEDVEEVKDTLRNLGVSDWCVDSPHTFVPTTYAPAGTIYQPQTP